MTGEETSHMGLSGVMITSESAYLCVMKGAKIRRKYILAELRLCKWLTCALGNAGTGGRADLTGESSVVCLPVYISVANSQGFKNPRL